MQSYTRVLLLWVRSKSKSKWEDEKGHKYYMRSRSRKVGPKVYFDVSRFICAIWVLNTVGENHSFWWYETPGSYFLWNLMNVRCHTLKSKHFGGQNSGVKKSLTWVASEIWQSHRAPPCYRNSNVLQEMGIISIASVFQSQFSKACVSHSYTTPLIC